MRWLAAAVLTLAASVSHAQSTAMQILGPSPWGLGISLAHWIMKDDRKVFYVEVTAQGRTAREAQELAMRMAVERAVGSVMASASVSERGRLARDEIIVYSAGYVDDHRIVEQRTENGEVQLRMQIWVGHSKLAHRLLGESRTEGAIEGGRISEQIATFQQQRQASDQILLTVLKDYPRRSFRVSMERTRVWVDNDRKTYIDIPFRMIWDPNYIASLTEAVRVINQRSDCDSWLSNCRVASTIRVGRVKSWFDDQVAYNLMYQEMIRSQPKIRVSMFDTQNQLRYQGCFNLAELDHQAYTRWNWVYISGLQAVVNPDHEQLVTVTLPTAQLNMQNLDRAEIDVVRLVDCTKPSS
jgi:hypothetical protein